MVFIINVFFYGGFKMNEVEQLYQKLLKCPIQDLLSAIVVAEESNIDEKRKDFLYTVLEQRLLMRKLKKK